VSHPSEFGYLPQTPPPGCPAHVGGGRRTPLYGPEFARDPHGVYAQLRQYGPLAPVELAPGIDATLVLGYDAALHVLRSTESFGKDARRWRAMAEGRVPADCPVGPMMAYRPSALFTDGDAHRRLRGAIDDALALVDPNALRGYVERSADALIDRFGPLGEADLLEDYAKQLPLLVFNQLFGCSPEIGDKLYTGMRGLFDGIEADKADALMAETFIELIATKRRQPGADMVSWLMAHEAQLTDEEMIHQLVVLTAASTEPQQNLIANAMLLLLSDDRFAGDLNAGSLPVEDALDWQLWTDPPLANYAVHYAFTDTDVNGYRVPAGEPLVVSLAAATTDPALATDQRSGNRAHLAWSAGPHGCPAQREARIIASVAIEKLLDRLPDIDLAVPLEQLVWRPGPFHRALNALPVRFPPVTGTQPLPASAAARVAVPAPVPPPAVFTPPPGAAAGPHFTGGTGTRPAIAVEQRAGGSAWQQVPPTASTPPRRGLWQRLVAWWRGE
jgi:cytochrome P450